MIFSEFSSFVVSIFSHELVSISGIDMLLSELSMLSISSDVPVHAFSSHVAIICGISSVSPVFVGWSVSEIITPVHELIGASSVA